ncbi:unnamed protein product [Moneuplotes crassus]|uniref:Uncharacterized protein n=1 Tax=Euplotes crassus TaxID=5936 RepID=A0AAD1XNY2_EUPCR|nr:unnamed protein product [Moneuplotes crassus]
MMAINLIFFASYEYSNTFLKILCESIDDLICLCFFKLLKEVNFPFSPTSVNLAISFIVMYLSFYH